MGCAFYEAQAYGRNASPLCCPGLASRQDVEESGDEDYLQLVVGTAAWMYRKRINGESEPIYLKRMRHDLLISQKMRGEENAP